MKLKNVLLRRWLSWYGVMWSGASPGCYSWRFPRIERRPEASIAVGSHCMFGGGVHLAAYDSASLYIGDHVLINTGARVSASLRVIIGPRTLIASDVVIMDAPMHEVAPGLGRRPKAVVIGRNVWIGTRAVILPGVLIGDHAVIGAGTVVSRDVPAQTILVGAAARVVGKVECADAWYRR